MKDIPNNTFKVSNPLFQELDSTKAEITKGGFSCFSLREARFIDPFIRFFNRLGRSDSFNTTNNNGNFEVTALNHSNFGDNNIILILS